MEYGKFDKANIYMVIVDCSSAPTKVNLVELTVPWDSRAEGARTFPLLVGQNWPEEGAEVLLPGGWYQGEWAPVHSHHPTDRGLQAEHWTARGTWSRSTWPGSAPWPRRTRSRRWFPPVESLPSSAHTPASQEEPRLDLWLFTKTVTWNCYNVTINQWYYCQTTSGLVEAN